MSEVTATGRATRPSADPTRERILAAALDLFSERSFEGATTRALATRVEGLRGVDEVTTTRLVVREFIYFSARHPQLHRIITQECKTDGPRMDWLVERHVRPLYEATTARFTRLVEEG